MIFCAAVPLLLWIASTDAAKREIPSVPLVLIFALGILRTIVLGDWYSLYSAVSGFLVAGTPMLLLACVINHGNSIGGGDVMLCAALGFLLGPIDVFAVVLIALVFLIFYLFAARDLAGPFAPFVLLGYDAVLFLNLLGG